MVYRENLMADAEEWAAKLFASRIRLLKKEYEKAERREEVKSVFLKLFISVWKSEKKVNRI